jgi:hypothetical protein
MTTKADYLKSINDILKQVDHLEDDGLRRAVQLLGETLAQIRSRMITAEGWRLDNLINLQQQVNDLIAVFQREMAQKTGGALIRAWELGTQSVDDPLAVSGIRVPIARLSRNVVAVLQNYSADLIQRIGDETRASINATLTQSMLGQQSPFDAMQTITNTLGVSDNLSQLTGVSARAEKIYRTEVGRVYSIATQARQNQVAELAPDLMKGWVATGDHRTRSGHLAAHGQLVKVNEPFKVAPHVGAPKEDLQFPRDPAGSAANTINCRCKSVSWRSSYGTFMPGTTRRVDLEKDKRDA